MSDYLTHELLRQRVAERQEEARQARLAREARKARRSKDRPEAADVFVPPQIPDYIDGIINAADDVADGTAQRAGRHH